jgi:uncharacterized protein YunC (DUF1805 family)
MTNEVSKKGQKLENTVVLEPDRGRLAMNDALPTSISRPMQFENGCALGISNRWRRGQYCVILTEVGLVGCGIYDMKTPAEFGQAIAIARGTPEKPLVNPEDLLDANIVDATPQAKRHGVRLGMTGREAVELFLAAGNEKD